MSTHVYGFKPPDEAWKKHKAVWDACESAGVPTPPETSKFFGHSTPDPEGVEVSERELETCGAIRDYSREMVDGYEIIVAKIPKDVAIIRVINSY